MSPRITEHYGNVKSFEWHKNILVMNNAKSWSGRSLKENSCLLNKSKNNNDCGVDRSRYNDVHQVGQGISFVNQNMACSLRSKSSASGDNDLESEDSYDMNGQQKIAIKVNNSLIEDEDDLKNDSHDMKGRNNGNGYYEDAKSEDSIYSGYIENEAEMVHFGTDADDENGGSAGDDDNNNQASSSISCTFQKGDISDSVTETEDCCESKNMVELLDDQNTDNSDETEYFNGRGKCIIPLERWNKEHQQHKNLSSQFVAKLAYRVRVVMIHPLFLIEAQTEHAFEEIYYRIFRENICNTGYTSAIDLCKSMPQVIDRKLIDSLGELHLVDSTKNLRAVSGIRSGLRRIVYDILLSYPHGISCDDFEGVFFNETGKTLTDVLREHAYSTPISECMIHDMLDIACILLSCSHTLFSLCKDAEDPSLTDGLLLGRSRKSTSNSGPYHYLSGETSIFVDTKAEMPSHIVSSKDFADEGEDANASSTSEDEKSSIICDEETYLQVRLRLRLLFAFLNSGNGIEVQYLCLLYQMTFSVKLDVYELGFSSIEDLINNWSDIALRKKDSPEMVFLQPSLENYRIVKTHCMGLRESVFSTLLSSYPDGVDVSCFFKCLDESYSEDCVELLRTYGYFTNSKSRTNSRVGEDGSFLEYCSTPFRFLVHDLSDFVRLGCQEDGSLIVKLRGEDFPLLDLPNYDLDGFMPENVWSKDISLEGSYIPTHKKMLVNNNVSVEETCMDTKLSMAVLKHQLLLILGSEEYMNSGITFHELSLIYEERTGHALPVSGHQDVNSLLSAMTDVVFMSSTSGRAFLKKSKKNRRILSIVKSGTRQVLYWSLLKNVGGIWDELLVGWYKDFVGKCLIETLCRHGYGMSKECYYKLVVTFLDDMSDFVCHHPIEDGLYILSEDADDPTFTDSMLLGMLPSDIQYDPFHEHLQPLDTEVSNICDEVKVEEKDSS